MSTHKHTHAHTHACQTEPCSPTFDTKPPEAELWLIPANTDWQVKLSAVSLLLRVLSPFCLTSSLSPSSMCVFLSFITFSPISVTYMHLFLSLNTPPPLSFPFLFSPLLSSPPRLQAGVELICQDQKGSGVTGDSCFSKINSQRRSKYSPLNTHTHTHTHTQRHTHAHLPACTKARERYISHNANVRFGVLAPCQILLNLARELRRARD